MWDVLIISLVHVGLIGFDATVDRQAALLDQ